MVGGGGGGGVGVRGLEFGGWGSGIWVWGVGCGVWGVGVGVLELGLRDLGSVFGIWGCGSRNGKPHCVRISLPSEEETISNV